MKRNLLLLISVFIFAFSGFTQKEHIIKLSKAKESLFKTVNKSQNANFFENSISEIKLTETENKKGKFVSLNAKGLMKTYKVGFPNLPVISKLIEVPLAAKVKFKIISYDEEIINLKKHGIIKKIAPAQASVWKSGNKNNIIEYNEFAYAKDFFEENEIAIYQDAGILRDKRIGRVEINPFSYNAKKNILKILNNLKVEIIFEDADFSSTQNLKTKYSSPSFNNLPNILLKSEPTTKEISTAATITYVIVSHPDFESSLQTFVEWKKLKGFKVIEAYIDNPSVGITKESIKSYLQNLYENPATGYNSPTYILFVGDIEQIPSWNGVTDTHFTDLYYCEYTGDFLPEVYYGRFSAQNISQLNNIIEKTLSYEKYQIPDPDFLGKHLLIAGVDADFASTYGNGAIRYLTDNYSNATNDVSSKYYLYGDASGGMDSNDDAASAAVVADLSTGYGIANYSAHCNYEGWADPNVVVSDLADIENTQKFGLWIGNCCESVRFENSECFGEAVLRLENKGAIGYIGGSDNTLWDEDYWWAIGLTSNVSAYPSYEESEQGAYDGAFHTKINEVNNSAKWYTSQGQINVCGNLAVQSSTSSYRDYYWEIYHLMGDPSLVPYLKIPSSITATINPSDFIVGLSEITVNTIANAYVALSQNGELITATYSNESGLAILNSSDLIVGDATIVITTQNKIPYIVTKPVAPANEPYVILDDKTFNEIIRNGNTVAINTIFKNIAELASGFDATNTNAILSTNSSFIQINDNSVAIGDIIASETKSVDTAFEFEILENTPDQETILFELTISHDGFDRVSKFEIIVDAPNIISDLTEYIETNDEIDFISAAEKTVNINSSYTYNIKVAQTKGNGNSMPDAGEDIAINFIIENNGHADIQNLTCSLSSESVYVNILSSSVLINSLASASFVDNIQFQVSINANTPIGEELDFKLTTSSGTIVNEFIFTATTGLQIESFESGDLNAFNWESNGNQDWNISIEDVFDGSYCVVSGNISDNQNSVLNLEINAQNNGNISFYKKVSSESNYDFLIFYIDDIEKGRWSGDIDWTKEEYEITEGLHSLKWEFIKDISENYGLDAAWIDYIGFPSIADTKKSFKAYTISATTKPEWLSLNDNGNGTALLSGTSPNEETISGVVLNATDGNTSTKQSFEINVQNTDGVEIVENEKLKLYPIPASDKINIELENEAVSGNVFIQDSNGKNVYSETNISEKSFDINISKLSNGIYFLNYSSETENFVRKIIIE